MAVFVADKQTLDDVQSAVNKISSTTGAASSSGSATDNITTKLNSLVSNISSLVTNWTSARAAKIDKLDADISSRAPASTALSNAIWTNERATKIDNLNDSITSRASATDMSTVKSDVTTIKNAVTHTTYGLSAIKNALTDGTNGLAAIKTALTDSNNGLAAIKNAISSNENIVAKYGTTKTAYTLSAPVQAYGTNCSNSTSVSIGNFVAPYAGEYRIDINFKIVSNSTAGDYTTNDAGVKKSTVDFKISGTAPIGYNYVSDSASAYATTFDASGNLGEDLTKTYRILCSAGQRISFSMLYARTCWSPTYTAVTISSLTVKYKT